MCWLVYKMVTTETDRLYGPLTSKGYFFYRKIAHKNKHKINSRFFIFSTATILSFETRLNKIKKPTKMETKNQQKFVACVVAVAARECKKIYKKFSRTGCE